MLRFESYGHSREIVVRLFRLAEDVDDHFVLPGREAPLTDAEVQCREACPQVAFGRNTLNSLRRAFRSVESGKYKVASLVTSYKFFFIIHFYLLVNKMVIKSGPGGRMYFMFPVNVALARTQG